jgi:hypothetical protein
VNIPNRTMFGPPECISSMVVAGVCMVRLFDKSKVSKG